MKDLDLIQQVRDYIQYRNTYVSFGELCSVFGKSRIYFTYRGVNITELNAEFGLVRRTPKSWKPPSTWTKAAAEAVILSAISLEGRYLSTTDLTRKLRVVHEQVIRGFSIDVDALNKTAGFSKKSSKTKISFEDLKRDVVSYVRRRGKYVSQDELVRVFKISLSYLTKSGLDTVKLNRECGYTSSQSWFEEMVYTVLTSIGVRGIQKQHRFKDCVSTLGVSLRFDFYLKRFNCVIEADGSQHWDKRHRFYKEEQVVNDRIKDDFCKQNGIRMVRIPYRRIGLEEHIRRVLLETLFETTSSEATNVERSETRRKS